MAIRAIRLEGDPILRKRSREVNEITDKIKILIDDMIETMYHEEGVGLAAVQIGVLKRIMTYDTYEGDGPKVIINPEVSELGEKEASSEGCLSVPGELVEVNRPKTLRVRGYDENFNEVDKKVSGLEARVICHELDHLNGTLIIDHKKSSLPGV